jgi:hypothetical protein
LKSSINEDQALKIMKSFDVSGDGKIQLDEFQGIDAFKLKFEKVIREEKAATIEAEQAARLAKKAAETAAEQAKVFSQLVNDKTPTASDRLVSVIPYLLPLADALPYSRAYIENNHLETSTIFEFAALVYSIYLNIPFAGLIAFILFNFISSNLQLNRLVRFNIQQAILLDIALIIPGLLSGVFIDVLPKFLNISISKDLSDIASTFTFLAISLTIIYSLISSFLGIIPDKIPLISERVNKRVPTTNEFLKMFDEDGNLRVKNDDNKNENKDKNNKKD